MKISTNKKLLALGIFWLVVAVAFVYVRKNLKEEKGLLAKYGKTTKAIITDSYTRRGTNLKYRYIVEGRAYEDSDKIYNGSHYNIDDTLIIRYYTKDPNLSEIVEE